MGNRYYSMRSNSSSKIVLVYGGNQRRHLRVLAILRQRDGMHDVGDAGKNDTKELNILYRNHHAMLTTATRQDVTNYTSDCHVKTLSGSKGESSMQSSQACNGITT